MDCSANTSLSSLASDLCDRLTRHCPIYSNLSCTRGTPSLRAIRDAGNASEGHLVSVLAQQSSPGRRTRDRSCPCGPRPLPCLFLGILDIFLVPCQSLSICSLHILPGNARVFLEIVHYFLILGRASRACNRPSPCLRDEHTPAIPYLTLFRAECQGENLRFAKKL